MGVANWLCCCILVWRNNFTICGTIDNRVTKYLCKCRLIFINYIRALLVVSYLSYYEVYHGNHMGQETMQMCSGLVQVTILCMEYHSLLH